MSNERLVKNVQRFGGASKTGEQRGEICVRLNIARGQLDGAPQPFFSLACRLKHQER
nr:hypothetical protein [Phenylobacterium sp.]